MNASMRVDRQLLPSVVTASLVFLASCTVDYELAQASGGSSLADTCYALEQAIAAHPPSEGESGLPPDEWASTLPGRRAIYYQYYCVPRELGVLGWSACGGSDDAFLSPLASPSCATLAQPYLNCLADEAIASLESCSDEQVSEDECRPPNSSMVPLKAASACPTNTLRYFPSTGGKSRFQRLLRDCPDGDTHGYSCDPPDDTCAVECECMGGSNDTVRLEPVHALGFEQSVWEACGLPAFETP